MSSNVPTTASVVIYTNHGPLDIDLWAKQTPKTSHRFLSNCRLGKYDGAVIVNDGNHIRVGDGTGETVDKETHSRLRFISRGILYSVGKPNTVDSFAISGQEDPELNGAIFGQVKTDKSFILRQLDDAKVVIESVEVKIPYFDDLPTKPVPEEVKKRKVKVLYEDDDEEEAIEFKIQPKKRIMRKEETIEEAKEETVKEETKEETVKNDAVKVKADKVTNEKVNEEEKDEKEDKEELKPKTIVQENRPLQKTENDAKNLEPDFSKVPKSSPSPPMDPPFDPDLDLSAYSEVDISKHRLTLAPR